MSHKNFLSESRKKTSLPGRSSHDSSGMKSFNSSSTGAMTSTSGPIPSYLKYAKNNTVAWNDPSAKLKPSELSKPVIDIVADDYPLIIEFNNIKDNSCKPSSTVDIDTPLFQPSPKILVFDDYTPFATHEKKIYFRNNDSVARRFKLIQPDTIYFEISPPKLANGDVIKQSKIASGMEICIIVKFKPQEVKDYAVDLICSTEREKFMIPIRAVGLRPFLTIPDEINFGSCPMKTATRKAILVQNTGNIIAQFMIKSNNKAFSCTTDEIIVHPSSSLMIDFFFNPKVSTVSYGEFELCYTNGVKCYIEVTGVGSNVDVALSTNSIVLESCYITLSTEKTIKIKNLSSVPMSYSWKSFAKDYEDDHERQRLLDELNHMEEVEMKSLLNQSSSTSSSYCDASFGMREDVDEDEETNSSSHDHQPNDNHMDFQAKAESAALIRKYRNLRQNLLNDHMLFVDNIFDVNPAEGSIWANSDTEVTITFRPDAAAMFDCTAYLDITGRQDRLSLHMTGNGIGPHAVLSYDILDVGDIFVNDEHEFELQIVNKGDIAANWSYLNSLTNFGKNFEFSPTEGIILPGKSQAIKIRFESNILGEFVEFFRFMLHGNEDLLVCQIKGHVIGPTFHFDVTTIDFGEVSYDYLHSTVIRMVNTSTIMMAYTLHIPQDGYGMMKEFNIEPSEGVLQAGQHTDILIEFIPMNVKNYEYSLAVDVLGVGDMLMAVPISARCTIGSVSLERSLNYDECFIRFPYTKDLILRNTSDRVHTKYSFLPQDNDSKYLGSYEVEPSTGVIEPNDQMIVSVRLLPSKLGYNSIPYHISIAGSTLRPVEGQIVFTAVGPKVKSDVTELRYGSIECLKDFSNDVTLTNASAITASIRMFLKMGRSKFRVSVHELVLEPYEEYVVHIIANLDDSVSCKDELHIIVEEGDNLMIPISAIGSGTTMHSPQDLTIIDLGIQLTNNTFEKSFILENKGRRQQFLRWSNTTVIEENKKRVAIVKKMNKDVYARLPKNLAPIQALFTIQPEEITLRPRTATTFTIRGNINAIGSYQEMLKLESRVGKERTLKTISTSAVKCEIITPLLEFSSSNIKFHYVWEAGVEVGIQRYPLHVKNCSAIPLSFAMKTEIPFNLSTWEHTLPSNESMIINIEFDPLYRDDKVSHDINKSIIFGYKGHAQRDSIILQADIIFPNLSFDRQTDLMFGSILNDTSKVIRMNITNSCTIPAAYEWQLVDSNGAVTVVDSLRSNSVISTNGPSTANSIASLPNRRRHAPVANIPLDSIIDILPTRSILQPGESQPVEFTYYGRSNTKFNCTAQCIVEGGPIYRFILSGEASHVGYHLYSTIIDYGKVLFTERAHHEYIIHNTGKVAIDFDFHHTSESGEELIHITPSTGRIEPGVEYKIKITIRPMLPTIITEYIELHIAHFDPVRIQVLCEGVFIAPVLTLPRYMMKVDPYGQMLRKGEEKASWDQFLGEIKEYMITKKSSMLIDTTSLQDSMKNMDLSATTMLPPTYPIIDMMSENDDNEDGDVVDSLYGEQSTITNMIPPASASLLSPNSRNIKSSSVSLNLMKETEMHRRVLHKLLLQRIDTLQSQTSPAPTVHSTSLRHIVNLESLVIATYHLDFGNIIYGQTRKRCFRVTNPAVVGTLSWSFDKKLILGTGYSFEPDLASKLKEGASLDVCVKYFARQSQPPGLKSLTVPLIIKGSPRIDVICTANVCLPEMEISSDMLNFEHVTLGQSKTLYLQLSNHSLVPCNWSIRRMMIVGRDNNNKDDQRFMMNKTEGTIRPGKKEIISIEFLPTEIKHYRSESQLKIEFNSKLRTITCHGYGQGYPIRFEPSSSITLGPILPYASSAEQIITIMNSSSSAVEIYAVDYDPIIRQEEEMLAKLTSCYDASGIIRTSLRKIGCGLPVELHDLLQIQDTATTISSTTAEDVDMNKMAIAEYPRPSKRSRPAPRDDSTQQDIIIMGAPGIGSSSLASSLSKRLGYVHRSLSSLLLEACHSHGEDGIYARRLFGRLSDNEQVIMKMKEDEYRLAADISQQLAVDAYKKQVKKKVVKEIPPDILRTEAVIIYESYMKEATISSDTISRVLEYRLSFDDVGYGIIVDGIGSGTDDDMIKVPFDMAMKSIQAVMTHPIIIQMTMKHDGEHDGNDVEGTSAMIIDDYQDRLKYLLDQKHDQLSSSEEILAKHQAALDRINAKLKKSSSVIEPMPMTGDESWYVSQDHNNQMIAELDDADIRQLDDMMRAKYHAQVIYIRSQMIAAYHHEIHHLQHYNQQYHHLYEDYLSHVGSIPHTTSADDVSSSSSVMIDNLSGGIVPIYVHVQDADDIILQQAINLLPQATNPPPSKDALPDALYQQIIRRPLTRTLSSPSPCFQLLPTNNDNPSSSSSTISSYRWMIPAQSSIQVRLAFQASQECQVTSIIQFEVCGSMQSYSLSCAGICSIPSLQPDPRSIFMKRQRASLSASMIPPIKKYIIPDQIYSFGALSIYKQPTWRLPDSSSSYQQVILSNYDTIRFTNAGKMKSIVNFMFDDNIMSDDVGSNIPIFYVEPTMIELDENEAKEVRIYAFPSMLKSYTTRLLACIRDNPTPLSFPITCTGSKPLLSFAGDWDEIIRQAEEMLTMKHIIKDKKLYKEHELKVASMKAMLPIDFGRVLIGKSELRQIVIKNDGYLPVVYHIECDDSLVSFTPSTMTIAPLANVEVMITFTSDHATSLNSSFIIKYSDTDNHDYNMIYDDNSLRGNMKKFSLYGEAYMIQAVRLSSDGHEGMNELDFGLMRVGDIASQHMKLENKGKYRIGYRIHSGSKLSSMLTIQPMEGYIEPGISNQVDITFTFCCSDKEISYKSIKDIHIVILEPIANEVVESFALCLSVKTKYSSYRLQPMKGLHFGAIRVDSGIITKTIELRNDGSFPFTYILCPSLAEHEEVDVLDPDAYHSYAYALPYGLRKIELGDGYAAKLSTITSSAHHQKTGSAGGKKKLPPTSSSKPGTVATSAFLSYNAYVYDPDTVPLPSSSSNSSSDNPLILGAFVISSRVGCVEPGQHISIEVKFNPKVCNLMKEHIRVMISGIHPSDPCHQILKSFDISGESCLPAIITQDVHHIFEEQEVVSCMAEFPSHRVAYAIQEKLLSFGVMKCQSSDIMMNSGDGMIKYGKDDNGNTIMMVERVKIINPTKVDASVRFRLTPSPSSSDAIIPSSSDSSKKQPAGKGKVANKSVTGQSKNASDTPVAVASPVQGFTIQPAIWDIPAHEARYVSIYFHPQEIKSYQGRFVAEVDMIPGHQQDDNQDQILSFDIQGIGALPSIFIEEKDIAGMMVPIIRQDDGSVEVNFGRVECQRVESRVLRLRNDSLLDATCYMDGVTDMFSIASFPSSIEEAIVISAGQSIEVPIEFIPSKHHREVSRVDDMDSVACEEVLLRILSNDYNTQRIKLRGLSYHSDVMVRIPAADQHHRISLKDIFTYNDDDEHTSLNIIFPEINLSSSNISSSRHVILKNSSDKYYLRYDMQLQASSDSSMKYQDYFTIKPNTGHLPPGGIIDITITFHSDHPIQIQDEKLSCHIQRIQYHDDESAMKDLNDGWNSAFQTLRLASSDDIEVIKASAQAWEEYQLQLTAYQNQPVATNTTNKSKKASTAVKTAPVPPPVCRLSIVQPPPSSSSTEPYVCESLPEPTYDTLIAPMQDLILPLIAVADHLQLSCAQLADDSNTGIIFADTYLYQSSSYQLTINNTSHLHVPLSWDLINLLHSNTHHANDHLHANRPRSLASTPAFTITPSQTIISPHASTTFTITFAPLDVMTYSYQLSASSTMLSDSSPLFVYPITAISLRPFCHVDIQESPSYLLQRPASLKNELGLIAPIENKALRVIEVESVGINTKSIYSFFITNPTGSDYDYHIRAMGEPCPYWRPVISSSTTTASPTASPMMISSGTRIQVSFEYSCEVFETVEAYYMLRIPSIAYEQLLLFVGKVREPKVHFSTSKLDFHEVILYQNIKQPVMKKQSMMLYIENDEEQEFEFKFDRSSLLQVDGIIGPILRIEPESGTIPSCGKMPINIIFYPQEEIKYNYNITCQVKKKYQKLSLNIKGEGYLHHPQLQIQSHDHDDDKVDPMMTLQPYPHMNYIDFGVIQIHDSVTKKVSLSNTGRYAFDYEWDVHQLVTKSGLSLTGDPLVGRLSGTVVSSTLSSTTITNDVNKHHLDYDLVFNPLKVDHHQTSSTSISLKCGRTRYNIMIQATAIQPTVKFSFMQHDFGPSFITLPGATTMKEEVMLMVTNTGATNMISIESTYQKTKTLAMSCPPSIIAPGQHVMIPIIFTPREVKDYHYILPFLINNTSKINVPITGRGITPRIELVHHHQHRVAFGSVNIGHEKCQVVEFINPTRKPLSIEFSDPLGKLAAYGITYTPSHSIIIPPKKIKALEVYFKPYEHIKSFHEDIMISYAGVVRKFLTVSGQSHGISAELDSDVVSYGEVVLGAYKMKKVKLSNTGDTPLSYTWLVDSFGPHFNIVPASGRIAPHGDIFCEVTFKPSYVDDDIRQEHISVSIAGIGSLTLTCNGICKALDHQHHNNHHHDPKQPSSYDFTSSVRKAVTQSIRIHNPTERDWYLTPSISSVHWQIPHDIKVAMKASYDMIVTYYPLTMTSSSRHDGELFIPLPDGNALLYRLTGTALPPAASGQIKLDDMIAKQTTTSSLSLSNWLSSSQIFDTSITITESPSSCVYPSDALSVIIPNKVELEGHMMKEIPIKIISYCEGTLQGKITFTNTSSGEYIYYTISATIKSTAIIDDITLEAPLREVSRHIISIENPLSNTMIKMKNQVLNNDSSWYTCDSADIRVREVTCLSQHHEGIFEIEYRPLKHINDSDTQHTSTAMMTIHTHELGSFRYRLALRTLNPLPTPTISFNTPLGSSQTLPIAFLAYNSAQKTDYRVTVERYPAIFRAPETIQVDASSKTTSSWEGREMKVAILFEPDNLTEYKDHIIIQSMDGSISYRYEVCGVGVSPTPQGPYLIPSASSPSILPMDIPIHNCFSEATVWTCIVDNPTFRLTTPSTINLASKADGKCSLTFDPWNTTSSPSPGVMIGQVVTGTLFVSCSSKPGIAPWTYYLRGVVEPQPIAPAATGKPSAGKK